MPRIKLKQDHGRLRQAEYPRREEQLDALWKIVNALIDGKPPPAEALAIRDQVAAVKNKYPKRQAKGKNDGQNRP